MGYVGSKRLPITNIAGVSPVLSRSRSENARKRLYGPAAGRLAVTKKKSSNRFYILLR